MQDRKIHLHESAAVIRDIQFAGNNSSVAQKSFTDIMDVSRNLFYDKGIRVTFNDCSKCVADARQYQRNSTSRIAGQGHRTGSQKGSSLSSSSASSRTTARTIRVPCIASYNLIAVTLSATLVLILMVCATRTAAAPASPSAPSQAVAAADPGATNRADVSATVVLPHQGDVGLFVSRITPSRAASNTRSPRQGSSAAGYNRVKRSASPYFTYGGYPTDVGGSGYPPYYAGRKKWNYSKFGNSGSLSLTVRIMLEALATHTRPIIDIG